MTSAPLEAPRAGIYVHIPFCVSKCRYCDFSSYPGQQTLYDPYLAALTTQIENSGPLWPGPQFDTLYVGGGTPTVLSPQQLGAIVKACVAGLGLRPDAEITCEANPGTVSTCSLAEIRNEGFQRLSLGVQSLNNDDLRVLGRIHDRESALQAFAAARKAGFCNINLDLIYGLPRQSLTVWRSTLEQALELAPEHLSLYALTLESGTPLAESIRCGALPGPDDDLTADMYALARELLAESDYVHYEISNWARKSAGDAADHEPSLASRHNLHYWHNDRYLGLGSAAHSFDGRRRYARCSEPAEFIRRVSAGEDTEEMSESIDRDLEMDETMMLGLRLMRGITWRRFRDRFGVDLRNVYTQAIEELLDTGLIVIDEIGIRLAPHAYLIGNRVFGEFLRTSP